MLLGIFLIVIGVILQFAGSTDLSTPIICNAGSLCTPLTSAQLWQLQGTYYIELYCGVSLIIAGVVLLLVARFAFWTKSLEVKKELTSSSAGIRENGLCSP